VGLKAEIVPLPNDVHGSIEIGIGFSLNGAPQWKFLVTELWGNGDCRKEETFSACVKTLLRALKRDMTTEPQPCSGHSDEPTHCPWLQKHSLQPQMLGGDIPLAPSVIENLQKLAKVEALKEKGRRLAEDGFPDTARKCFEECNRLVPAFIANRDQQPIPKPAETGRDYEEEESIPEGRTLYCSGVSVLVDGLIKSCYLSLAVGRWDHAIDMARQAYALDPERVDADPLMSRLHNVLSKPAGCCQQKKCPGDCTDKCPDCPDCPCCPKTKTTAAKPVTIIILGSPSLIPQLPRVDPKTVKALDDVLNGSEGEEQEAPVYQKAIAKPYRETNNAPAAINKGE
jgi:hypothetical protein